MRKTEEFAEIYRDLETRSGPDILSAILDAQRQGVEAVGPVLPQLAAAAEAGADRLRGGKGRIVYAGAGTSARLGVQDGVELVPTFGWPENRLAYLIAGGPSALMRTAEGAEDDRSQAVTDTRELVLGPDDVCIALSASGTTPYAIAAVETARETGALTVAIANNPGSPLLNAADHAILIDSGPEPVGGSTRMTAGTTQKIALNLMSTLTMTRLGRVYRGMMVDVTPTNEKLRERAVRIVSAAADCDADTARIALDTTGYAVKPAILVAAGIAPNDASRLLDAHGSDLHAVFAAQADD